MGPTASPPWRMLETASNDDPAPSAPPSPAGETDTAVRLDATSLRLIGIVVAVAILAVAAFAFAATSGAGDGVQVDALGGLGSPLPGDGGPLASDAILVVEVSGAVARPGVYRLGAGARVADAIDAAGGYSPRVDTARSALELDLVAAIVDGGRIHVPSRDEPAASAAPATAGGGGGTALIDLNSATLEALDTLPGIGPVTAEKIVAARDEAPFASVDDLRSRGVLGEKTFERIRELVTVP